MTITVPDTLKQVYNMNGAPELPFYFPIAQSEDIRVYSYDTVEGEQVLLEKDTDYTVAFTDDALPSTGSVTILSSGIYNDTNLQVTLTRSTEKINEYDLEFDESINPDQLEFEEDRQVMMNQDLESELGNAIKLPASEKVEDDSNILPTKALRANSLLGFDEDGNFSTSSTLLDEVVQEAVEEATAQAEAFAQASSDSADDSLGYALKAEEFSESAQLAETNVNNVINNAGINEINFFLGDRVDSTATLTYGGRV